MITQLAWVPCTFTSTILRTTNNSPTIVHAHRIKIHLVRPISGVTCCNGCVEPPAQDYSEGDINEDRHLTANSDRLSHFGRRMSLFQLTLILGGLLFREQEHREEHMNLGGAKQSGAENG
jgi:hypothetical protein